MNKNLFSLLLLSALLFSWGCGSSKKTAAEAAPQEIISSDIEIRNLDTLLVSAPATGEDSTEPEVATSLGIYQATAKRVNDLLHTRLDLRFDWEKEQVIGKATLRFKPFFHPTSSVELDAKDFEFKEIRLEGSSKKLDYAYDGQVLTVNLDRPYKRTEEFTLFIDYVASPSETGGSDAITSNQGLFFIKPDEENPDKPMQIWTQGETNWNSRWFPTIDHPNERTTQEIFLTVEDRFKTLSNGVLASSKKNADGTRTDHWKMDLPHAPYLFMIAVGEYAVVRDKWKNIPLAYYVEPKFEQDARAIFPHTPEMLQFFTGILKFEYPWPKYDQIIVRDYVSGAMENTTAVIFGEFMQQPRRNLIDERTNEKIVAHEMIHHWFGDLVTCESWANLTMNEGFANYSEYLWLEHKYGRDEADFHLLEEWEGYFNEAQGKVHPLIHFGYEDNEEMFDRHSYNKGGSVLHMLRHYLGDEVFYAALNQYLTKNAFQSVEVHDLRLAMEAVSGEDLNWFFNQWFLSQGHPQLTITYGYEESEGMATVTVEQTQDAQTMPAIFQLPAAIDIYLEEGQKPQRHQVRTTERKQTFSFPAPSKPKLILFDAEHVLLAQTDDNLSDEELAFRFRNAPQLSDRYVSLQKLLAGGYEGSAELLRKGLNDPFWYIRGSSLVNMEVGAEDMEVMARLREIAARDTHSQVRAAALGKLGELEDQAAVEIAKTAIEKDSALVVISTAFDALVQLDRPAALALIPKLTKEDAEALMPSIASLYAESGEAQYLPFFEERLEKVEGYAALDFFASYLQLAYKQSPEIASAALNRAKTFGMDTAQPPLRRLAGMNALYQLRSSLRQEAEEAADETAKQSLLDQAEKINAIMKEVAAAETDEQIKSIYEQLFQEE